VDSQSSFLFAVDSEVPQTSELEKWQSKGLHFKSWCQLNPERQAGVVVLVHAKKENGEYAGSVGIGAAADTIIQMRAVKDRPACRRLEVLGRWSFPSPLVDFKGDVEGYVAAVDDDAETVIPGAKPKKQRPLSGEMLRVFTVLRSGMAFGEWETAYVKQGG